MSVRVTTLLWACVLTVGLIGPANAAETPALRTRAFAALPNWTGLWETEAAGRLRTTGQFTPPTLWDNPPYNAEWEKKLRSAMPGGAPAAPPTDLPPAVKVCGPVGFPAAMEFPVPDQLFELLITPEQTLLVATDGTIRHIYTDGRKHPDDEDLWATPEGHSVGHWQGETLNVETVARTEGPVGPTPEAAVLSEQARFTEKLRRLDADTLQNEMTIEDPERFSRPWKLVIRYKRVKDVDRMIAVNCRENDRNPVIDGKIIIAPL